MERLHAHSDPGTARRGDLEPGMDRLVVACPDRVGSDLGHRKSARFSAAKHVASLGVTIGDGRNIMGATEVDTDAGASFDGRAPGTPTG
jgi:hypothetical protein